MSSVRELPERVQEAMQMQVEVKGKNESGGIRETEINEAEGLKWSRILASEAQKQEKLDYDEGELNFYPTSFCEN